MSIRHSSAEAYHGITSKTATDRDIIAQLVRQRGPMTRRQIASFLHMETSSVSGRVNELMADEVLKELDELRPCPETGRRVAWLAHADDVPGFQMSILNKEFSQ